MIENENVKIWIENNILIMNYQHNLIMDLNVAKGIVDLRLKFTKQDQFPLLVFVDKIKSITKEAREYMATEGTLGITSNAIIVDSPVTKIMGNFYITLNKPLVPTKLFTSGEEGKKWLNQYIVGQSSKENQEVSH